MSETVSTPHTGAGAVAAKAYLRERIDVRSERSREWFARNAAPIARCAAAMADRFFAGGTLLVFGNGVSVTDAHHNAVEYVHPVLPGCRALPAIALTADGTYAEQLRVLGRAGDIALAFAAAPAPAPITAALREAGATGMQTIALTTGGAVAAEHVFDVDGDDPLLGQELHLATYHILWELVHIVLNHRGIADAVSDAGSDPFSRLLYPMLSSQPPVGAEVLAELARAPVDKAEESDRLRRLLLDEQAGEIVACAEDITSALRRGGRVLACGNGGSATSAADMVAELMSPPAPHPPLPALCLTADVAIVTAVANDVSFDDVFARQLIALGRPEDAVVAVSTSGNSENLVRGLREARHRGMRTVALCGYDGGRIAREAPADHCLVVPSSSVHRIQEVQTTLQHLIIELLWRSFSEEPACA